MEFLKIKLEEGANAEKIMDLLLQIKGIKAIEIETENPSENDIRKVVDKSKNQLKSGEYEAFVNDLFDAFLNKKS